MNKSQLFKALDPSSLEVAVQSATAILARRDHCRQELISKLQQRGFKPGVIADTIAYCQQQNWLNEAEYTRIYLRARSAKGYGLARIKQELQQKGIGADDLQLAVAEYDFDWFELALQQRIKRFGETWPDDFKARQKQQNYLYRRGFNQEQIRYACFGE